MGYDTKSFVKRVTSPYWKVKEKGPGTLPAPIGGEALYLPLGHMDDDLPDFGKTQDRSGNDRDGTKFGTPVLAEGYFGKALKFDGTDDRIEVAHATALNPVNALVFAAHIFPEDPGTDGKQFCFFKDQVASVQVGYQARKRNIRFRIHTGGAWSELVSDGDADAISNPDFETYTTSPGAPDDWTSSGATLTRETSIVQSGSNAVKVVPAGSVTSEGLTQELSGLIPGVTYRVTVYGRGSGTDGKPRLKVNSVGRESNPEVQVVGTTAAEWQKLTATFVAEVGKTYTLALYKGGLATSTDTIYFDNTSIVDVNAAAAPIFEYGRFAHVLCRYDGVTMDILVDGVVVKSKAQTGTITGGSGKIFIGSDGTPGNYFKGRMSHLFYDTRTAPATTVTAYRGVFPPTNFAKMLAVFADAWWADVDRTLWDLRDQGDNNKKRGGVLTKYAADHGVPRKAGEADASLRYRLQSKHQTMLGGTSYDDVLGRLARLLKTTPDQITIVRNKDLTLGHYRPRYFYVELSNQILTDAGVTAADVEASLDDMTALGMASEVKVLTDATWDTATYDGTDVWGT